MFRKYIKKLIPLALISLLPATACKESGPTSRQFSWSADGSKLALVTHHSNELLLVEIENDTINNVRKIDRCNHFPEWSADGRYILYTQSSPTYFKIQTYSLTESKIFTIKQFNFKENKEQAGIILPTISPVKNEIIIFDWKKIQLLISDLTGEKIRVVKQLPDKISSPVWSADGDRIYFIRSKGSEHSANGLWKINRDGTQLAQVYPTFRVLNFKISPEGKHIAIAEEYKKITHHYNNVPMKENTFRFAVIDTDGQVSWKSKDYAARHEYNPNETQLFWSPDSRKMSYLEVEDEQRNVRVVDIETGDDLKLTLENAAAHFGWGNSDQFLFTKQIPESLVKTAKHEDDYQELAAALQHENIENQLVFMTRHKLKELDSNVFGAAFYAPKGYLAYFKKMNSGLLESNIYYPVLRLAGKNEIYLARTDDEHRAAMDYFYQQQNYQKARLHLNQIIEFDINSPENLKKFDIDSIFYTQKDTLKIRKLFSDYGEDIFLRTVLLLRKLNQPQKADWLLTQYQKLWQVILQNPRILEKGNEINKDEFFWSVAQIYGRLGEFEAGRKDLESLQAIAPDDSLFTGELLLIRALFADGTGKQDQAFDYIDQALQILPRNNEDFGDIAEFVAILLFRPKNVSQPKFDSLKQILLKSSAEIEDITEFFETIGDFYRETSQPQKAFQAYQKAVSKNFDKHQIWEKIIEIEIKKEPLK